MAKNLVIVESPAKAKTIEKILGKDFSVKSSYGHVRDLIKGNNAVDVENDYEPHYDVSPDKQKVVKELKAQVKKVDEVWLATDEDREGEAISWHLCNVLGLDSATTKRIVFREITKPAIQNAIQNPRVVDINLVNAQQARRILDRLVGFELSGLLWRKIKGKLSAGRVQSVAVKLVVERERQIQKFEAKPFFKVSAIFLVKNQAGKMAELKAELPQRLETEKEAGEFLNACAKSIFSIGSIEKKPIRRKPTAPFITSTLQQDASRKLGFSVKRTMINAQKLYEAGLITYMRTDSVNLSEVALTSIAQEIESKFGKEYVHTRRYKTKKSNAQEAHEAIRPTYIERMTAGADRDQQRLYELIWKRTIASQMADAELEKTIVRINISEVPDRQLKAEGEVLKFDGFLKVYLESSDEDEDDETSKGILPPLSEGQELDLGHMTATQRFTRPPARFTEAALVKKMEELGIGRPSTYAPTISKIMEPARGYVYKGNTDGNERAYQYLRLADGVVKTETKTEMTGAIKNRLVPSDMGMVVVDYLDKHFDNVMDYSFTANIEKRFDGVAEGKEKWQKMLDEFYVPFHKVVEETMEHGERADGERILGKDPETGLTVLVRMTRLGRPVVQIGSQRELGEDDKPKYANLRPGQRLETLELEPALKLFELPKDLGEYEGQMVTVAVGRFGPYVKHNEKFVSLPKGEDPMEIKFDRAVELIEEKKKADAPVGTYDDKPITKGKGRFGPFLKWNDWFINIPRRFDPETISDAEMYELIEAKIEKEANRYIKRFEEEKIDIENARWGPIIRFKKKRLKLPKVDDKRMTPEQAAELNLEAIKAIIVEQMPNAFPAKKKKAPAKKKTAAKKKTTAKRTTRKKTTTKKTS
ncbi:MAG: type I DNA topoisomerase [Saprospiraceae bacterium]|nr:type I DNA topoisomerase [Saprospiraceae bacterium]